MATYECKYGIGDKVFLVRHNNQITEATVGIIAFSSLPVMYSISLPLQTEMITVSEKSLYPSREAAIIATAEQSELFN
jgi:hypothetical protein